MYINAIYVYRVMCHGLYVKYGRLADLNKQMMWWTDVLLKEQFNNLHVRAEG